MKNEFVLAFNEVLEEKQLPKEIILQALEAALVSAYRRAVNASSAQQIEAKLNLDTGDVVIFAEKEIVESIQDDRTEVSLDDALKVDPEAQLGGLIIVECTPTNFGRVAAQTARQVIQQRIREAERDAQLAHYSLQVGEIVSGVIQATNSQAVTLGLDMKAEGIMPRNHQIPGEKYRVHDRIRALLLEVKTSPRGPQIVLSRAHRNFLRRLLENEVPEIYHGLVEIRSISREPGQRSKVAVSALQTGVDPVGACVGLRGVRIQAIVKELNEEKIDVIEWNPDPVAYIAKALSPARVTGVYLNEHVKGTKTATVVVPEDQLSLAIGRDGQNARLAARLTSWRIDIKSLPEAATDAVYKLQKDPEYAIFLDQEAEFIPQIENIMAKKAEGRPVTPEEYHVLSQFVDRIERGLIKRYAQDTKLEEERQRIAEANIPEEAYEMQLEDIGIPLRYSTLLNGAGIITVGDLMLQMKLDPNSILGLPGIGAKAIQVVEEALEKVSISTIETAAPILEEVPQEEATVQGQLLTQEGKLVPEPVEEVVVSEVSEPEEKPVEVIEPQVSIEDETVISEFEKDEEIIEAEQVEGEDKVEIATKDDEEDSLEEIFTMSPESLEMIEDYDADDDDTDDKKAKKKKKKKYLEYEYDPEQDVSIVKKKRKREDEGWENWSL